MRLQLVRERVAMQISGHKTRAVLEGYIIVSVGDLLSERVLRQNPGDLLRLRRDT